MKVLVTSDVGLIGSHTANRLVKGENIYKWQFFYADNLTNLNLRKVLEFRCKYDRNFTMAFFKVTNSINAGLLR